MKFIIVDEIPFSRDRVFAAHRDKLPEMVGDMPNIESIRVESRVEDGDIVRLVNIWHGSQTDVPAAARAFIKPDMLRWTDTATWDEELWECQWKIELGFLPGAIFCNGTNTFEDHGDVTRIHMDGEIRIDATKIPGVPRLMASSIGGVVEKFVVKLVEPNLKETNKVVARYLSSQS